MMVLEVQECLEDPDQDQEGLEDPDQDQEGLEDPDLDQEQDMVEVLSFLLGLAMLSDSTECNQFNNLYLFCDIISAAQNIHFKS